MNLIVVSTFTPFDLAKMAINIGSFKKMTLEMLTFQVIISSMCKKVILEPVHLDSFL